jgi:hypothetical protein
MARPDAVRYDVVIAGRKSIPGWPIARSAD